MKKGIIMGMDDSFLTLLTPEGEFLRARRKEYPYTVGEEIQFIPMEIRRPAILNLLKRDRLNLKHKPVWAVSTAAALLIFLGSLLPMYQDNKAYAYMSIDGSSSIELGVNKNIEVVELKGYNKEGKSVISHISNWKQKEASQIAKMILAEMQKEGQLKKDNQVIISTVPYTQPDASAEKMLKENLNQIKQLAEKDKLQLTLIKGTEIEREKAQKEGLTTGKYEAVKKDSSILQPPEGTQNSNQTAGEEPQKQSDEIVNIPASQPAVPPGQLKKQEEAVPNVPASTEQGETKPPIPSVGINKIPPGLEKKQQVPRNVNPGQLKKNDIQNHSVHINASHWKNEDKGHKN